MLRKDTRLDAFSVFSRFICILNIIRCRLFSHEPSNFILFFVLAFSLQQIRNPSYMTKKWTKRLLHKINSKALTFFCIFRFNGFERTSSATFWIISRKTERARVIPTYVFEQFL